MHSSASSDIASAVSPTLSRSSRSAIATRTIMRRMKLPELAAAAWRSGASIAARSVRIAATSPSIVCARASRKISAQSGPASDSSVATSSDEPRQKIRSTAARAIAQHVASMRRRNFRRAWSGTRAPTDRPAHDPDCSQRLCARRALPSRSFSRLARTASCGDCVAVRGITINDNRQTQRVQPRRN